VALITVAVLIPLIFTDSLPKTQLTSFLVARRRRLATTTACRSSREGSEGNTSSVRCQQADGSQDDPQRDRQYKEEELPPMAGTPGVLEAFRWSSRWHSGRRLGGLLDRCLPRSSSATGEEALSSNSEIDALGGNVQAASSFRTAQADISSARPSRRASRVQSDSTRSSAKMEPFKI